MPITRCAASACAVWVADQALTITTVPALPAALSGAHGANRALLGTPRQIAADTDVAAIGVWLAEYVSSPHTFRSYRKEAERLLVWATQWRGKAISSLTREDVLAYEAFLTNPPADWCDDALARRGEQGGQGKQPQAFAKAFFWV